MKFKYIIFIIFLSFYNLLTAQNNFERGYIITNDLDTLYGFIENNSYAKNAQNCFFKANEKDQVQKLSPEDIHSYKFIDGKYYISKEVNYKDYTLDAFLEYLIKGKLNIYYFRYEGADLYFAQKENEEIFFLENDEVYFDYDEINKKWVVSETKTIQKVANSGRYKGLLTYITKEAPLLKNQINNASLNHKSLIKLAKKYHYAVCNDEGCTIYEKKKKPWFSLGVVQGYSKNLKLNEINTDKEYYDIKGMNYPGIEMNTQFLTAGENVNFKVQVYFYSVKSNTKLLTKGSEIDAIYFKVPIMFGYSLKLSDMDFYVNAGVSVAINMQTKVTEYDIILGEAQNYKPYYKDYFDNNSRHFGAIVSTGIKYNIKSYYVDVGLEYDYYGKLHFQNMLRPRLGVGYKFN